MAGHACAMHLMVAKCPRLGEQCSHYILMNLEQFSPVSLALLPLTVREEFLQCLPVADLCRLEHTAFTDGVNMDDHWRQRTTVRDLCLPSMKFPSQKQRCYLGIARSIICVKDIVTSVN